MTFPEMLVSLLLGVTTGLALIVPIGAQNACVLRLGISGDTRTILSVVLICALSDAALIVGGVVGVGALIKGVPFTFLVVRSVGAGFLIVYAMVAAARVFRPQTMTATGAGPRTNTRAAAATVAALTWLNPHVYLDTVILLGSLANQQGALRRWW